MIKTLRNTLPCRKRTLAGTIFTEKALKKIFSQKLRTWTEHYSYSIQHAHNAHFLPIFFFCDLQNVTHNYNTEIMNYKDIHNVQVTSFPKKDFNKSKKSCGLVKLTKTSKSFQGDSFFFLISFFLKVSSDVCFFLNICIVFCSAKKINQHTCLHKI